MVFWAEIRFSFSFFFDAFVCFRVAFLFAFPDLPGCLSSGETVEEAFKNAEDAKHEWLLAAIEEGISIPEPDSIEDYSGQFKLRLPRSLHRQLALQSKREGVSMNQYCVFLLSQNNTART